MEAPTEIDCLECEESVALETIHYDLYVLLEELPLGIRSRLTLAGADVPSRRTGTNGVEGFVSFSALSCLHWSSSSRLR